MLVAAIAEPERDCGEGAAVHFQVVLDCPERNPKAKIRVFVFENTGRDWSGLMKMCITVWFHE